MKVLFACWLALLLSLVSPVAPVLAADEKFSKQQLDQMLAPIALYPDDLLSNVLMASTYPLDVVEAQRWRQEPENAKLTGDALTDAAKSKNWDPSIKALLLFPDVLTTLSEKLDWTQNLGTAFLNQQSEVMDQIQFLRSKADSSGHLKSNTQQKVIRQDDDYIIEPVNPDVVYVPVYEPEVVYGPWWYPDYPPYYWGYPGAVFDNGFWWGVAGVAIVGGIWGWNRWDWRRHDIHVDVNKWNRINGNRNRMVSDRWKHDPHHGGALRPRDKGIDRAEQHRELSKELRRTDGDRAGKNSFINKGANKGVARDASRFRDKKQFHNRARNTGAKFNAGPKRSFNRGAGQVRSFKAAPNRGAAHHGRRR